MAKEELTRFEKAGLLAIKDFLSRDNYDKGFYELLCTTKIPSLLELDDAIRPAIVRFIVKFWEQEREGALPAGCNNEDQIKGALTLTLLIGYELGRKLRRPLTAKRVRLRKT